MTGDLRGGLLAIYADEHRDHLAALRTLLARGGGDLEEAYRHAHSLKGAARAVELPIVVDLAHGLESLLEAWWEGRVVPDADMIRRAQDGLDAIEDLSAAALTGRAVPAGHAALERLAQGLVALGLDAPCAVAAAPPPAAPVEPVAAVSATMRVETEVADRLAATAGRLLAELDRLRRGQEGLRAMAGQLPAGVLYEHFAELLRGLEERDWALSRAAADLAEDVLGLRRVAAEAALGGFGPMLRALAVEQGKEIRFDAAGLDTAADREVLVVMAEAVGHLLRNAVAHGIEAPSRRRAAGKDAAGQVTLTVAAVGPRLDIRVADDGAGINTERLAAEATERGLLTAEQASRVDPGRLRQLIFQPGLTTAATLDTAAGRGMGMSIVRRLVDRLQGDIVLRSSPGRGTEVIVTVPVSAMAQRVVLVLARGQLYGLPALAIRRLAYLQPEDLRQVEGGVLAVVDGAELPLVDLGGVLGLAGAPETGRGMYAALLRLGGDLLGLVVDRVVEVRELVVSPLDPMLVRDDRLAGSVVLEGGRLAFVLSPAGLRPPAGIIAAPALRRAPPGVRPLVLVVDDSPTVRSLERTILEASRFRVLVAVDGAEALTLMAEGRPDVVVSDIEMPRLDGFGLLAAIRADPVLAGVPVLLVSSRAGPEDRRRAQELGANGFLSKQEFDQGRFLAAVHGVTA